MVYRFTRSMALSRFIIVYGFIVTVIMVGQDNPDGAANEDSTDFGIKISPSFSPYLVDLGDSLVLYCSVVTSSWEEPALSWSFNGEPITTTDSNADVYIEPAGEYYMLRFKDIKDDDSGWYTCTGKLGDQENSRSIKIESIKPATINSEKNQHGLVNQDGKVFCNATATPRPSISWRFGGKIWPIKNSEKYVIEEDGLVIKNLQFSDARVYVCDAAVMETGSLASLEVNYTVVEPAIYEAEEDQHGTVNQNGTIVCNVTSNQRHRIDWRFENNTVIRSNDKFVVEEDGLLIKDLQFSDAGIYKCEVLFQVTGEFRSFAVNFTVIEDRRKMMTEYLDSYLIKLKNKVIPNSKQPQTPSIDTPPCQDGWMAIKDAPPYSCIFYSKLKTWELSDVHEKCLELNASLIMIQSEKKLKFFKEFVSEHFGYYGLVWVAIQNRYGNISWLTKDGHKEVDYVPTGLNFEYQFDTDGYIYSEKGDFRISNNVVEKESDDLDETIYICEKPLRCEPGWHGPSCDHQCHCHGQECSSPHAEEVTCDYGCQIGWTGKDCSRRKEIADVSYLCVNSQEQGKYAHIRIDKKGTYYETIHPVSENGDKIPWCSNFDVVTKETSDIVSMDVVLGNKTDESMEGKPCAGKIGDDGKYEWQLRLQEREGIVSRNDKDVHLECDFSQGDKLQSDAKIKHESISSWFNDSKIIKPVDYIKEKKHEVQMEVVDPATGKTMSETTIGGSVVLRIVFGSEDENTISGVRPYNCYVSTADGKQKLRFLDSKCCPMKEGLISDFHKNGTSKSLLTHPFSLFGLDSHDEIHFHCSFDLCFDDPPCFPGCDESRKADTEVRNRRSTRMKPKRKITGTIGIVNNRNS